MKNINGFVNSIQSLGTVDGPGVRFVLFMQGCNLRCGCCHNPETQKTEGGDEYSPDELIKKIVRYKAYFGNDGGVTLSGGEPLLQAEFARELFILCHENAINTCLDTSGSILNDNIKLLLEHTDRVLLDIKYTDDELYKEHAGCSLAAPLEFLSFLDSKKIPTTIRQVIIPDLNDDDGNIRSLCSIIKAHSCVDSFELLPFKKLCIAKYEKYGMDFKFKNIPEPDKAVMERLNSLMMSCL